MSRVIVAGTLIGWVGATLLLSELRWFRRPSMADRLRPYAPRSPLGHRRVGVLSVDSFREVITPLARTTGAQLARMLGISEELSVRLQRIHSDEDVTAFRLRQLASATVAFGAGLVVSLALDLPGFLALLILIAAPALAYLVLEQQVALKSEDWQRRVFLELPVVAEQLGMLLSSGYSLGAALSRIAERGDGTVSTDLGRICRRIRQGLTENQALREWQEVVQVDAVERLVAVLTLNREAGDLGGLIAE
ncbi:MAG: type II secretion system F family protein, partial [Acidimicrobiales bacterium]